MQTHWFRFLVMLCVCVASPSWSADTSHLSIGDCLVATSVGDVVVPEPLTYKIPLPPLRINPNAPLGSVIYSGNIYVYPESTGLKLWCHYPPTLLIGSDRTSFWYTQYTPIPGIQIELTFAGTNGNWTSSRFPIPSNEMNSGFAPPGNELPAAFLVTVKLIKTGPIAAGGQYSGPIVKWVPGPASGPQFQNHPIGYFYFDSPGPIEYAIPTCTAKPPAPVDLGKVPLNRFASVGSTSDEKPFSINLTCVDGAPGVLTSIYMTLTDQANPANRSNALSLSADSKATGVGIQVLHNASVIKYGADDKRPGNENQWLAQSAVGNGVVNIPLSARYVRLAQTMTAGTANGRATFTMSYQ